MSENINIDELLRQSFLDLDPNNPANDQLFELASQNVYGTDWSQSNQIKNNQGGFTSLFRNWKFYLTILSSVGLISTGVYFLIGPSDKKNIVSKDIKINHSLLVSNNGSDHYILNDAKIVSTNNSENNLKNKKSIFLRPNKRNSEPKEIFNINNIVSSQDEKLEVNSSEDVLTLNYDKKFNKYFSERERAVINEQINELAVRVTSRLSEEFPMIPGAAGSSNGKTFQVAFHMWPTEITVSEYELFLNDLLLEGKSDEFEMYRPNLNNGFGSKLSDEDIIFFHKYFTDPSYSKHPMVFVSPEGAIAFCNWLQDLINETNLGHERNAFVRLPSKWEWERAAAGGKEHVDYGTYNGELTKGFMNHKPEANYSDYQLNSFAFTEKNHYKKDKNADRIFNFTTPVKSFKANPYGLFDMSGNVSEMVIDVNGNVIAKGGCWNSSQEFLRIRDDDFDEFPKGAYSCPFIGFRPVVNFK